MLIENDNDRRTRHEGQDVSRPSVEAGDPTEGAAGLLSSGASGRAFDLGVTNSRMEIATNPSAMAHQRLLNRMPIAASAARSKRRSEAVKQQNDCRLGRTDAAREHGGRANKHGQGVECKRRERRHDNAELGQKIHATKRLDRPSRQSQHHGDGELARPEKAHGACQALADGQGEPCRPVPLGLLQPLRQRRPTCRRPRQDDDRDNNEDRRKRRPAPPREQTPQAGSTKAKRRQDRACARKQSMRSPDRPARPSDRNSEHAPVPRLFPAKPSAQSLIHRPEGPRSTETENPCGQATSASARSAGQRRRTQTAPPAAAPRRDRRRARRRDFLGRCRPARRYKARSGDRSR